MGSGASKAKQAAAQILKQQEIIEVLNSSHVMIQTNHENTMELTAEARQFYLKIGLLAIPFFFMLLVFGGLSYLYFYCKKRNQNMTDANIKKHNTEEKTKVIQGRNFLHFHLI